MLMDITRRSFLKIAGGTLAAAMRRGGFYGQLRSTITYQAGTAPGVRREGTVHIKIFNLLMHELGPDLLRKGIFVPSGDLAVFLSRQPESFWAGCSHITLDGRISSRDLLLGDGALSRCGTIHLTVKTEP